MNSIRIPYSKENLAKVKTALARAMPNGKPEPSFVSRWHGRILGIDDPDATVIVSGWHHGDGWNNLPGKVMIGADQLKVEVLPLKVDKSGRNPNMLSENAVEVGAIICQEQVLRELAIDGLVSKALYAEFRRDYGFDDRGLGQGLD